MNQAVKNQIDTKVTEASSTDHDDGDAQRDSLRFRLPACFNDDAAAELRVDFLTARIEERDVVLDGSAVGSVGTAALQLLVSARKSFTQRGLTLEVAAPSEVLARSLNDLGLRDFHQGWEVSDGA